ncbi:MAG TPA: LLM class flavin-dependent oxidoreductase [Myxococcota bacterium]|nr:LLM class flavin-dependent oxidoreductase [Myxococcota bacterium]
MAGKSLEIWTISVPLPKQAGELAARAEAAGWDGIAFTDSQNLTGDVFTGLALAAQATRKLGLATGVTNPVTRHAAAAASAIASIQALSGGRATLGIGRGDSALFQIGLEPAPLPQFERFLGDLAAYLRGGAVDVAGYESRLRWLDAAGVPRVPIDVAATGPRVIEVAARIADRITFALGASPERLRWGIEKARAARRAAGLDADSLEFGAYVNVAPHPDVAVARELVRGGVGTFAHFSGMRGSSAEGVAPEDRAVFEGIHARYDRPNHTLGRARHAAALDADFLERFAVVGPTQSCVARLRELAGTGLSKLVLTSASFDANRTEAQRSRTLLEREVLPALRGAS